MIPSEIYICIYLYPALLIHCIYFICRIHPFSFLHQEIHYKDSKLSLLCSPPCLIRDIPIYKRHWTLKKSFNVPAEDRTGDPSIYSLALYHVAIKAGLYRKAVQVYHIPNLYPVTFSPSILNSSSNSQKYKNHWK